MVLILKNILLCKVLLCKVLSFWNASRKAVTRASERQEKYLFKSCDFFPNGVLPTKRDVLQRLLHERN